MSELSLAELRSILQGQIDSSGTITIDSATLDNPAVDPILTGSALQTASLVVATNEQIPPPEATLTVNGTSAMLGLSALPTTVVFEESGGAVVFTLTATLPAGWTFQQTFTQVFGSTFELLVPSSS